MFSPSLPPVSSTTTRIGKSARGSAAAAACRHRPGTGAPSDNSPDPRPSAGRPNQKIASR